MAYVPAAPDGPGDIVDAPLNVAVVATEMTSLVPWPTSMLMSPPLTVRLFTDSVPIDPTAAVAPGAIAALWPPTVAAMVTSPTLPLPASVPAAMAELLTFTAAFCANWPVTTRAPSLIFVSPV